MRTGARQPSNDSPSAMAISPRGSILLPSKQPSKNRHPLWSLAAGECGWLCVYMGLLYLPCPSWYICFQARASNSTFNSSAPTQAGLITSPYGTKAAALIAVDRSARWHSAALSPSRWQCFVSTDLSGNQASGPIFQQALFPHTQVPVAKYIADGDVLRRALDKNW